MYQALYRKWRPGVFADVVGQDHITTTLMNEIETGRHSHAYLFTGSRGTGKTTCAKIFAKAVNCEHPINGDPCNECDTCKGIDSGAIMDVIEIDAASNNGVDNIRDIRDEANFTPVNSKYRVYIIDEVHMLSTGAFNALLKTLEEPPAHVKFILATTEVHKLPATILSRCQRFDFKRITPEDIAKRLSYVAEQEGLELEADAAMLIARLADGALRDALSILDQCIGHSRHITLDVVNATVGLAGKDYLFALSTSILNKDSASALSQINTLHNNSCDMERLCNELTNHFRNLMVCKAVKNPSEIIVASKEELAEYQQTAAAYTMDFILEVLNVLGDTLTNLRRGLNRRVEMEMSIIRLCTSATTSLANGATPLEIKEIKVPAPIVSEPAPIPVPAPAPQPEPAPIIEEPAPVIEPEPKVEAEPVDENQITFGMDKPEEIPFPDDIAPPAAIIEQEPVVEKPAPAPVIEQPVAPEHVSLTESLPDGEIPLNVWNALIREVVSTDKALIGTMNSAKPYKKGNSLVVVTDNILLKRFLPMDTHKETIYNATFTVLGEYLTPRLPIDGETFDTISEEPAPVIEEVKPEPIVEEPKVVESLDIPSPNDEEEKVETTSDVDPLDAFIDRMEGQVDFSFFVEE